MQLLEGDLHDLLHKQKVKLSLFQKMKLAKDAALGMNWLHNSNPRIIHRGAYSTARITSYNLLIKGTMQI